MRRVCCIALVCASAAAGLTGCGSGGGVPVSCRCPLPSVRRAWAIEVTTAGRLRWQTPLAAGGNSVKASRPMSPLAVGVVVIFTQDDVVYGLRLADGHRLWSWASPQPVGGMWRWQGLVVVLALQRPGSRVPSRLTGLDASTGQVRWTLHIPGAIPGDLGVTADGGLALVREDGVLQVVDLSGGRVRWARPAGFPPDPATGNTQWAMAVAVGMVLLAVNGRLTSYDDRAGRVRWTEALMPIQLAHGPNELRLQVHADLVYLTAVQQRTAELWTPVLLVISAVNGRLEWRFAARSREVLDAYAAGLVYTTTNSGGARLYHLDPATGRMRWRVTSGYPAAVPLATSAGFVTGSILDGLDGMDEIIMRDALTGASRWAVRLFGLMGGGKLSVLLTGPLVVVTASSANRPYAPDLLVAFSIADGHRVWEITMPMQVPGPLSAVSGGMLVQSATVAYGCA
jgi:outer membrane protein assembly factor BamB